jgi:hypothetical protein
MHTQAIPDAEVFHVGLGLAHVLQVRIDVVLLALPDRHVHVVGRVPIKADPHCEKGANMTVTGIFLSYIDENISEQRHTHKPTNALQLQTEHEAP